MPSRNLSTAVQAAVGLPYHCWGRLRLSVSPQFGSRLANTLSAALLTLAVLLGLVLSALTVDRPNQHWANIFQPAARTFAAGGNPYGPNSPFFNPPWVLVPLVPLALLPTLVGQMVMAVGCALSLYFVARRLGASRLAGALVLVLPATVFMYRYVNLDWLVALGLVLPPPLGLFFVLAKPQLGLGLAVYWLALAFRRERYKGVLRTFAPLALAGLASVLLYGPWFAATNQARLTAADWNLTLWPWTAPVGLLLIYVAIRRRWLGLALFGGALLSPYMAYYSWTVAMLGLLNTPRRAALVLLGLMAIGLYFLMGCRGPCS